MVSDPVLMSRELTRFFSDLFHSDSAIPGLVFQEWKEGDPEVGFLKGLPTLMAREAATNLAKFKTCAQDGVVAEMIQSLN